MIKLIKSTFYKEQMIKNRLCKFIEKTEILSMGEQVKKFEEEFAKWQKRKYAVMVNSGSSANLAIIQTLLNLGKLNKGDKVGVSALTWSTNVFPLIQLGLKSIVIDVDMSDLNMGLEYVDRAIEKHNLKAIFITHALGLCSQKLDVIQQRCDDNNIILLEDTCESLGSEAFGKILGNFGLASTFSFYVAHQLSTIEGGMVCTDDYDVYNMLKMVRAHGWAKDLDVKTKKRLKEDYGVDDFYELFTFYVPGYNIRPMEINAFIGRQQMPYLNEICNKRSDNFEVVNSHIKENDKLLPVVTDHMDFISSFSIPIICIDECLAEELRKKFMKAGIESRPIISGSITQQPVFDCKGKCYNAEEIHRCGFYIPNNPELTKKEIMQIIKVIKNA